MGKSSDEQSNIVDGLFGDDTGFLSGLGIDLATEKVEKEQLLVVDKEATPEPTKEKSKDVFMKDDIVPTMKEAKVISRQEKVVPKVKPKIGSRTGSRTGTSFKRRKASATVRMTTPSQKERTKQDTVKKQASNNQSRKEVDDLIQKKSQQDYSSPYSNIGRKSTGSGGGVRRGGGGARGRRGGRGQFAGRPRTGTSGAAITLGVTRRGRKNTPVGGEKKEKIYKVSDSLKKKGTITIGDAITVKEFSEKMGVPLPEVMKVLLSNKILVAAHANIDFDTAVLIGTEFEVTVERAAMDVAVEDIFEGNLKVILDQDKEAEDLIPRAPIVTIMGHVDHGKTRLLDYLRQTDVIGGEAGGITQSIGASQIVHNEQKITFIDTPGHELFTAIRARGSKLTNIVVIVVAADDGVKPQTVEAINHAKDANVPMIVAITKIDLGSGKIDEIKGQLAEHGLQPEDRGGDIMLIPCSSVTGQGIDDLLDAILLQYEMLEVKYSPSRSAVGVVIEAHRDAKQGVTTSMLVMTGTLRVGDIIVAHNTYGRVRRMMDRTGKQIKTATGGDPVMILGIQKLPEPGRVTEVVASDKEANKKIDAIQAHEATLSKEAMLQTMMDRIGKGDKVQLKLIIKADSFGSLEAAKHAAMKVPLPENVELKIVHNDVGSVTSSDLVFAQASGSLIAAFNVSTSASLKKKASQMKVVIKEYDIIYEFIEYIEKLAEGMIEVEEKEVIIGKLEVLATFYRKGKETIFGGRVTEGRTINGAKFRVFRESEQEFDEEDSPIPFTIGTIMSLQKDQDSVKEIKEGHECGMKTRVSKKLEPGDTLEFYIME